MNTTIDTRDDDLSARATLPRNKVVAFWRPKLQAEKTGGRSLEGETTGPALNSCWHDKLPVPDSLPRHIP